MLKIKNSGLDQYGAEPFEQQQFGTDGVERVNTELCMNAACRSNQFECMSGSCIPLYQRCDGEPHCPLGEDELNCPRTGE